MKKLYLFLVLSILVLPLAYAQHVPYGMQYQAVARDLKGQVLANQEISLRVSLVSNYTDQEAHYTELHHTTTNQFGLFSVVVGEGTAEKGAFKDIPWSTENIWMQVAIRTGNNHEFVTISSSKLLAVPYAFHAGTASEITGSAGKPAGTGSSGAANGPGGSGPGVPSQVWSLFGNSNIDPLTDFLGSTNYADLVLITDNLERLRITKDGDVNIQNNLNVGNNVDIGNDLHVGNDATIDRNTAIGNDLAVNNNTDLNLTGGRTINNGPLTVANASPTLLTGTLQTDGAADLNSTLHVVGATDLDNTLNVDGTTDLNSALSVNNASPTALTGTLAVDGATDLNNTLTVDGATDLNSTLNADGATTLGNTLAVAGATTLNNTLAANGQVTINANMGGNQDGYSSYPLRVQGSDQGVAIKLNPGSPNKNNNFITFFSGSGNAVGRIEGETMSEVATDPEYIFNQALLVAEEATAAGNVGSASIPIVVGGVGASSGPCVPCMVMAAADLVLATTNLVNFNIYSIDNLGVTYQSGSADYAEWLERSNFAEKMSAGDIVAVKGGKISKHTAGAQQLMVISTKPAVLGNMPPAGAEAAYEKVAFMGQIPVNVRGIALIGDYILPSGLNDGTGIAVSPEEIEPHQYKQIVGVAWSEALVEGGTNRVNMAIGLNTNDLANLAEAQEKKIQELESKYTALEQRLLALETGKPAPLAARTGPGPAKPAPAKELSRYQLITQNMPPELSNQVMADAIAHLKAMYQKQGISYQNHPGLNKLFTDTAFQAEVIRKAQQRYKDSYQSLLERSRN